MTQRFSLSTVIVIAVLTLSSFSLGAGKPPGDLPVISILESGDYRILSDNNGWYLNGSEGVQSILQRIGDWVLDTQGRNPMRKVSVDFTDPVLNSGADAPFEKELVVGRFIAQSAYGPVPIREMTGLGSSITSPLVFGFDYGTKRYRITMNPFNFTETNFVRVTCTGVSGAATDPAAPCNEWAIEPSVVSQPIVGGHKNIAQLLEVSTKGQVLTDLGDFYLSFRITITMP